MPKPRLCLILMADTDGRFVLQSSLAPILRTVDAWALVSPGLTGGTFHEMAKMAGDTPGRPIQVEDPSFKTLHATARLYATTVADWMLILNSGVTFVQRHGVVALLRQHLRGDAILLPVISGQTHQQVLQPLLFRCSAPLRFQRRVMPPFGIKPGCGDVQTIVDLQLRVSWNYYSKDYYRQQLIRLKAKRHPQSSPNHETALEVLDRADCHFRLNNMQKAFTGFKKALALFRTLDESSDLTAYRHDRWYAQYHLGLAAQQLHQPWQQVERLMRDALELDGAHAEPLFHLARHYESENDTNRANKLYQQAFNLGFPFKPWLDRKIYEFLLPYHYARHLHRQRKYTEVIAMLNQSLDRLPFLPRNLRVKLMDLRSKSYRKVTPVLPDRVSAKNHLVVITSFKNAGAFLQQCVESLKSQDYPRFRVILIDDGSTDGAVEKLNPDIKQDPRFTLICNADSKGLLKNQIDAVVRFCKDEDIVVYVDGDDWLPQKDVLSKVNAAFHTTGCWIFYSQYTASNGTLGLSRPLTDADDLNDLDHIKLMFPLHITAHRAGLLFRLKEIDARLECYRDKKGAYLNNVTDMAMFRALFPLAGKQRIFFLDEPLYAYNTLNPTGHDKDEKMKAIQSRQYAELDDSPPLDFEPLKSHMPD